MSVQTHIDSFLAAFLLILAMNQLQMSHVPFARGVNWQPKKVLEVKNLLESVFKDLSVFLSLFSHLHNLRGTGPFIYNLVPESLKCPNAHHNYSFSRSSESPKKKLVKTGHQRG